MKTYPAALFALLVLISCNPSKKIRTHAASIGRPVDSSVHTIEDTLKATAEKLLFEENVIPFQTFSAKVKVQYEDAGGKQPEVNAFVRMKKDQAIWISIAATFMNIEAFRVLITPDSVFILNKFEKTCEQYPFSYVQNRISAPVSFNDVQMLLAGKAALTGDSLATVKRNGDFLEITLLMKNIFNSFYYTIPQHLLAKQSVHVSIPGDNYTANVLYEDYSKTDVGYFSTSRDINIPEKSQHIILNFRQVEFNNELSLPFNKPEGYTIK